MKVLITGVSGFIGSHLVHQLSKKKAYELTALVRPESDLSAIPSETQSNIKFEHYDTTFASVSKAVQNSQAQVIVHLASCFIPSHNENDLDRLCQSNLVFGLQLLEAASKHHVRSFINTGTAWQHYNNAPYDPVNLYAASKQAFEDLLVYYVNATQLKAVNLKLFDTYGPKDSRKKIIHLLLEAAHTQIPLGLSPGDQILDLVHVDDVVRAFEIAIEHSTCPAYSGLESFAVSSQRPLSLKQIVHIVEKTLQLKIPVSFGQRPYRKREVMHPWNQGPSLKNWRPQINLENGIQQLALCQSLLTQPGL